MDDFARVKAAVDIVTVVGQSVPLKKAGSRFVGLCPFHAEKSPSFGVNPEGQYFKCFGCGKGGDVFVFLQELNHIEPVEALRRLAEENGITLSEPRGARGPRQRKERLLEVMERAQHHFRQGLHGPAGQEVVVALESRGIRRETQDAFGLGYAVSTSQLLVTEMAKLGFDADLLEEAGLIWQGERGTKDVFRERIMIPIRDERSRVLAFGGRRRRDGPEIRDPKYMNSKESPLFHKSRVLYGMDRARQSILQSEQVVLVEGYMDVIMAHQAGVTNTVAALGTSVTKEHCTSLSRLAKMAILFLDGDEAGHRAALRAVPLLVGAGLKVRVVSLSDGQDPGDYFGGGAGAEDFEVLWTQQATPGLDFLMDAHGAGQAGTFEAKTQVARAVSEALMAIEDAGIRASAQAQVAHELDLPLSALQGKTQKRTARERIPHSEPEDPEDAEYGGIRTARDVAEEELLLALVQDPDLREVVLEILPVEGLSHPVRTRLLEALAAAPTASVLDLMSRLTGEKEAQRILLDLVERPVHASPGKLFDGALQFFERERKTEQRRLLQGRYKGALRRGDTQAALKYLSEYQAWHQQGRT